MQKIILVLTDEQAALLRQSARYDYRDPHGQATYLLVEALKAYASVSNPDEILETDKLNSRAGWKAVSALKILGNRRTTKDIANLMNVSYVTASSQLREAEQRGAVKREPDPTKTSKRPRDLWSIV